MVLLIEARKRFSSTMPIAARREPSHSASRSARCSVKERAAGSEKTSFVVRRRHSSGTIPRRAAASTGRYRQGVTRSLGRIDKHARTTLSSKNGEAIGNPAVAHICST